MFIDLDPSIYDCISQYYWVKYIHDSTDQKQFC